MTLTDVFKIAGGIVVPLGLLAGSVLVGSIFFPLSLILPFLVFPATVVFASVKGRKSQSQFLQGLLIGSCISLLICTTCDVWNFTRL